MIKLEIPPSQAAALATLAIQASSTSADNNVYLSLYHSIMQQLTNQVDQMPNPPMRKRGGGRYSARNDKNNIKQI